MSMYTFTVLTVSTNLMQ